MGVIDTRLLELIYSQRGLNHGLGVTIKNEQELKIGQPKNVQRGRPTKARLLTLLIICETSSSASNSIQPE